jgi:hypothetical protein
MTNMKKISLDNVFMKISASNKGNKIMIKLIVIINMLRREAK